MDILPPKIPAYSTTDFITINIRDAQIQKHDIRMQIPCGSISFGTGYFDEIGRWYPVDHNFKAQAVEKMEITGDWQPANSGLKAKRQGSKLTIPFYGKQVALKGSCDINGATP